MTLSRVRMLAGVALVLVISLGIIYAFSGKYSSAPQPQSDTTTPLSRETLPPFTPEVQAQLAASKGFAVLVSYTDAGFRPAQVSVKKGEAVRFTNNSSGELWIAAEGTPDQPVYPGTSTCGGTALDTCKVLKPKEFWEFTFEQSGTWMLVNNLDKNKTGEVRVTVN